MLLCKIQIDPNWFLMLKARLVSFVNWRNFFELNEFQGSKWIEKIYYFTDLGPISDLIRRLLDYC